MINTLIARLEQFAPLSSDDQDALLSAVGAPRCSAAAKTSFARPIARTPSI
jgi:hypothetical protein